MLPDELLREIKRLEREVERLKRFEIPKPGAGGGGGAPLGSATPEPTGTAEAGDSTNASHEDHIHALGNHAHAGVGNDGGLLNVPYWFNVKNYGVVGDDATDDADAFQDAVDACEATGGGTVYIPVAADAYKLSSSIVIDGGKRITLFFEAGAILHPDAGVTAILVHQGNVVGGVYVGHGREVLIESPQINGQSGAGTTGIEIRDSDWVTIKHPDIRDCDISVLFHAVLNQCEGCHIYGVGTLYGTGEDSDVKFVSEVTSNHSFAETHLENIMFGSGANGGVFIGTGSDVSRSWIVGTSWPRENETILYIDGVVGGSFFDISVDMALDDTTIKVLHVDSNSSNTVESWMWFHLASRTPTTISWANAFDIANGKLIRLQVNGPDFYNTGSIINFYKLGESYPQVKIGHDFVSGGGIGFGDGTAATDGSLVRKGAGWLGATVPFGLPVYTTANRPSAVSKEGALIYDSDVDAILQSDGINWKMVSYAPVSGYLPNPTTSLGDMVYRSDLGGNVALTSLGASATGKTTNAGFIPNNAIDGNDTGDVYSSMNPVTGQWIRIDLGGAQEIISWRLKQSQYNGNDGATSYKIQYCDDDINFNDLLTHTVSANDESADFPTPTSARYWRFWALGGGVAGWEIQTIELHVEATYAALHVGAHADGEVMTLVSGLPEWAAASAGAAALDDLTDVNAPSPTDQDVLTWDNATSRWIAQAPPAGGAVDASDVTYTPAVATDWDSDADPGDVDNALDQLAERVDDLENGAGSGDVTYAAIQASQLVNEIKGWPPIVNTGDLDALNLWWDKVGTPTTAPSVVAVSGEAGVTENYELALKVVADGANEGLGQTWTFADEPRVKSGRKLSVILAIWSVSNLSVTAKLVNSDASHTDASAVTAAAWTIVTIENHTLAGTTCQLTVTAAGAGTFYVVPLGTNIGEKAFPLKPRGLVYKEIPTNSVVNNADPGGVNYADLDLTAQTSPLAAKILISAIYAANAANRLDVRRNGATNASWENGLCYATGDASVYHLGRKEVVCDDGQIVEWGTTGAAANTEHVYLDVDGWWEWE